MNENRDETEIDLLELFHVLLQHILPIILVAMVFALITFLGTKLFITPTYQSTTKLYVLDKSNNESNSVNYSDLQTGTMLVKDYQQLIISRPVMEQVIGSLNLDCEIKELSKQITVTTPTDTRVLSITVTDTDPYQAKDIANSIRDAAAKQIADVMDVDAVNVVEEANIPTEPSAPSAMKNTMIGGLIGLVLAAGYFIIQFLMNDTLQNADDVEKYLGLSVLGTIPMAEGQKKVRKTRRKAKGKR